jgi:CheY-specific phosphatase CheX
MTAINTLDLKGIVSNSILGVFDTMLSLPIAVTDTGNGPRLSGKRLVGSVSFAGDVIMGDLMIQVSDSFALLIAADLLGMEPQELDGEEDVNDVIGELSNMIGGDLKSRLCDAGLTCQLSIPSITRGTEFSIESVGWSRHEYLAFQHQDHMALVDVFVKPGS